MTDQSSVLQIISDDSWLEPYRNAIEGRYHHYRHLISQFEASGGLMGEISHGYRFYGFNRGELNGTQGVWYREWAPSATSLALVGDFNQWNRDENRLSRDRYGTWSIFLSDEIYAERLVHGSRVKVHVDTSSDGASDRIPAYAARVIQDPHTLDYSAQYWMPDSPYTFQHAAIGSSTALRIYEAHIGMAQEDGKVGSFAEFTQHTLPRISHLGYNTIQLMAIMEHPYYGSFGYHVSSFYAVSSRFGTPEDLKKLIDAAHALGIRVLLDIVHSHAVKNTQEGLNRLDGTDYQYFHSGSRGYHAAWDSMLFDYGKYEVQRFLLSNIRYWLEEFRFDGFRFDGVTSMLYRDHGLGSGFSSYDDYFGGNVDGDALAYLQLANVLAHEVNPNAVTIAEDVSGLPGMARTVEAGGIGFDYRLAMGVPDYWVKTLKETSDEDWNLHNIYDTLLNRRFSERHVGYAESHDQSLVGDKTLAFQLMDQSMYWNMAKDAHDILIDRGIALHKMIRLLTFSLAGDAYLNFMGNEFGHPEWVDFPRVGNGFSYHYARRQWSLVDNISLRYHGLNEFDRCMQSLDRDYNLLGDKLIEQLALHEDTRQLVYRRGPLVFVFNFHASESYVSLRIPVPDDCDYRVILDTDSLEFAGHGRTQPDTVYTKLNSSMYGRDNSLLIYLPSRSAQVLAPVN